MEQKKNFSIKKKMYIFVAITLLVAAFGMSALSFFAEADQIDRYYKQNTADNARNFASMVDGDYLKKLRVVAESEEYQALREKAEEADDEQLIEDYLKQHELWEEYSRIRDMITDYINNMEGIKYLYIIAHGDENADHDMYLVDDKENPIYETGYYEEREPELLGMDITNLPEPTISKGDWGWLCSDFKPVYSSDGECICIVGCDVGMDDIMAERQRLLIILFSGALVFSLIMLAAAVSYVNRSVVRPLDRMTTEMKKFTPSTDYNTAGVMNLDIRNHDEIGEIYQGIREMQINIVDYLRNLNALEEDKRKAENDLKNKDKQIGELSKETYTDTLTGVGSKAAYAKKINELNQLIKQDPKSLEFALVMVDMNNLKNINDKFGHRAGDNYIQGCCRLICEIFKHSPVYRVGGDEFVAVLHGKDYNDRKEKTDKLKAEYEKYGSNEELSPWLRYSAAVGMAEYIVDDKTAESVFRRADKAMYEDKNQFKKKFGGEMR